MWCIHCRMCRILLGWFTTQHTWMHEVDVVIDLNARAAKVPFWSDSECVFICFFFLVFFLA